MKRGSRRATPSGKRRLHPDAAGIDVGSSSHYVAVPEDRDPQPVRCFGAFTEDLFALADWLTRCGSARTVAMEATGVYWIPLFEILDRRGFEVVLVNARHVKNVPGRKSDVIDCQWLQELHSLGLLSASFRPSDQVVALRGYVRQRKMLVEYAASHVQHIQKALAQMNLQHNVASDVTGVTGMKILRAILAGERDPQVLASYRDYRCKASIQTIEKSLIGNFREEHLFALRQAVDLNDFYERQIADCDRMIDTYTAKWDVRVDADRMPSSSKARKSLERGEPQFDLRTRMFQILGVDLTQIDGIRAYTVLQLIAEIGTDMSRWPTADHFASWLALCPGTKITGGRRLSGHQPRKAHRAATILRIAAVALRRSDSALGAFLRRKRAQLGPARAVTATAHKLARLVYTLLSKRTPYVDPGQNAYEERFRERTLRSLERRAATLGFTLTPIAAEAGAVS